MLRGPHWGSQEEASFQEFTNRHWRIVWGGCFGNGIGVDGLLKGVGQWLVGEAECWNEGGANFEVRSDASFEGRIEKASYWCGELIEGDW